MPNDKTSEERNERPVSRREESGMDTVTAVVERHFWRCSRCLTIFATEGPREEMREMACACGARCQSMGRVERGRLVEAGMRCACDARCTSARGPKCDCQCGGKNHGSGRVVFFKRDMGEVPQVTLDVSAAVEKVEIFETVAELFRSEIAIKYPELAAKRRGEWVGNWDRYMEGRNFVTGIHKAKRLKSHGGRMKALTSLKRYAEKIWGQEGNGGS